MSDRVAWLKRNEFSDYFSLSITRSTTTTEITGFSETSVNSYYMKRVALSDIAPRIATNLST